VPGVTYDTGALVAAERDDRRMWALHMGFIALEVVPVVPAPVVAKAWRGGARQANLARDRGRRGSTPRERCRRDGGRGTYQKDHWLRRQTSPSRERLTSVLAPPAL